MSGGNAVITVLTGKIEKGREFDVLVAVDAWVGGDSCEIPLHKRTAHLLFKNVAEIRNEMWDAELTADIFGISHSGRRGRCLFRGECSGFTQQKSDTANLKPTF